MQDNNSLPAQIPDHAVLALQELIQANQDFIQQIAYFKQQLEKLVRLFEKSPLQTELKQLLTFFKQFPTDETSFIDVKNAINENNFKETIDTFHTTQYKNKDYIKNTIALLTYFTALEPLFTEIIVKLKSNKNKLVNPIMTLPLSKKIRKKVNNILKTPIDKQSIVLESLLLSYEYSSEEYQQIENLIAIIKMQNEWNKKSMGSEISRFISDQTIKPVQKLTKLPLLFKQLLDKYQIHDNTRSKLEELHAFHQDACSTINKLSDSLKKGDSHTYEEVLACHMLALSDLHDTHADVLIRRLARSPFKDTLGVKKLVYGNHPFTTTQQVLDYLPMYANSQHGKYSTVYSLLTDAQLGEKYKPDNSQQEINAENNVEKSILFTQTQVIIKDYCSRIKFPFKKLTVDKLLQIVNQFNPNDDSNLETFLNQLIQKITDGIHFGGYFPPEFSQDKFGEMLVELSALFDKTKKAYNFDQKPNTLQQMTYCPKTLAVKNSEQSGVFERQPATLYANFLRIKHYYLNTQLGIQLFGRCKPAHPDQKAVSKLMNAIETLINKAPSQISHQYAEQLLTAMLLAAQNTIRTLQDKELQTLLQNLIILYKDSTQATRLSQNSAFTKIVDIRMSYIEAESFIFKNKLYYESAKQVSNLIQNKRKEQKCSDTLKALKVYQHNYEANIIATAQTIAGKKANQIKNNVSQIVTLAHNAQFNANTAQIYAENANTAVIRAKQLSAPETYEIIATAQKDVTKAQSNAQLAVKLAVEMQKTAEQTQTNATEADNALQKLQTATTLEAIVAITTDINARALRVHNTFIKTQQDGKHIIQHEAKAKVALTQQAFAATAIAELALTKTVASTSAIKNLKTRIEQIQAGLETATTTEQLKTAIAEADQITANNSGLTKTVRQAFLQVTASNAIANNQTVNSFTHTANKLTTQALQSAQQITILAEKTKKIAEAKIAKIHMQDAQSPLNQAVQTAKAASECIENLMKSINILLIEIFQPGEHPEQEKVLEETLSDLITLAYRVANAARHQATIHLDTVIQRGKITVAALSTAEMSDVNKVKEIADIKTTVQTAIHTVNTITAAANTALAHLTQLNRTLYFAFTVNEPIKIIQSVLEKVTQTIEEAKNEIANLEKTEKKFKKISTPATGRFGLFLPPKKQPAHQPVEQALPLGLNPVALLRQ